jgi:hypothetical protein
MDLVRCFTDEKNNIADSYGKNSGGSI